MNAQLQAKTDEEFVEYLEMVADDFRDSGMDATAEDYDEMVRRMKLLHAWNSSNVVDSTAVEIKAGTYVGDTCPRCGEQFKYPGLHECHNQTTKVLSDTSM